MEIKKFLNMEIKKKKKRNGTLLLDGIGDLYIDMEFNI